MRFRSDAVVKLVEVEKTAGILFRAFGGDPGLKVAAATLEEHGARRRWLQRLAGSNERIAQGRRDAETLRLPPEIAAFPEKSLNRDLYLWLSALAASDVAPRSDSANTEEPCAWGVTNASACTLTNRSALSLRARCTR